MTARVAVLSPLPPARTGVAHYVSMLLPALRERVEVEAFGSLEGYDRGAFDVAVYQLGNNPHHEFVYREAMARPGVVVLHDVVLHHLIVEMTLARGDVDGYVAALAASHGAAGAAWARGRAAGLHSEMGNFLLPASIDLARRSLAVLVHNSYAASVLRSFGVTTPIIVAPHPPTPGVRSSDVSSGRARGGVRSSDVSSAQGSGETSEDLTPLSERQTAEDLTPGGRVVGLFGFLTSAKRAEVVLEAFRRARSRDRRLRLLVVGEPAPNIAIEAFGGEGITVTGFVPDKEFGRFYSIADRLVNLRYPSAGESSGTLVRAFSAGKAVAVSDYAQFAEFPDDCVVKIPLGEGEVEALTDFLLRDIPSPAAAQRRWLDEHGSMAMTVEGYLAAIETAVRPQPTSATPAANRTLPVLPRLEIVERRGLCLLIRNIEDLTLRARSYGVPGYRVLAKFSRGGVEVGSRWIEPRGDVLPGGVMEIDLPDIGADTVRLIHAIQGMPVVDERPWAVVEIDDAR